MQLHFLGIANFAKESSKSRVGKTIYKLYYSEKNRVGNSLFGVLSKSLVFCEKKSDESNESNSLLSLFKKERQSEEGRERFALGHKRG